MNFWRITDPSQRLCHLEGTVQRLLSAQAECSTALFLLSLHRTPEVSTSNSCRYEHPVQNYIFGFCPSLSTVGWFGFVCQLKRFVNIELMKNLSCQSLRITVTHHSDWVLPEHKAEVLLLDLRAQWQLRFAVNDRTESDYGSRSRQITVEWNATCEFSHLNERCMQSPAVSIQVVHSPLVHMLYVSGKQRDYESYCVNDIECRSCAPVLQTALYTNSCLYILFALIYNWNGK
jgi:hypothetical protein